MKIKIILPLIAIIFLSSCASKFSLTKRKYTNGYYFTSSKNSHSIKKTNAHENIVVSNLPKQTINLSVEAKMNEVTDSKISERVKISNVFTNKKEEKHTTPNLLATNSLRNNFETTSKFKVVSNKQAAAAKSYSKGGDTDSNLILQIILCLFPFLCLIGVYLHDGKSITNNFWIDLILHLTVYGECIFAILVVLDVIDLK